MGEDVFDRSRRRVGKKDAAAGVRVAVARGHALFDQHRSDDGNAPIDRPAGQRIGAAEARQQM
jgi:hypothetical protein